MGDRLDHVPVHVPVHVSVHVSVHVPVKIESLPNGRGDERAP